jgi:hypothetical protein
VWRSACQLNVGSPAHLHADRNPLFRKLPDAKGPPWRVANTRASALRSGEAVKWFFNASTAGDKGTSLPG